MPYATNPEDKVRIYYQDIGDGRPLVLLHGLSQSGDTWHRFGYVEALEDEHRLLIVDARAHGKSEGPFDKESYATPRMVGDIVAVLDHAGVAQTLYYGYSMGGRMGFGLGIHAPERVSALAIGGAYPSNQRPPALEARIPILRQGTQAYIEHLEGIYGDGLE
ncbi:MAG: alpha/beta fold hydrolase [Thermomicrobiales bacterium]